MAAQSDVVSEIEVLQSIYLDELKVTKKNNGLWEVSLVLYPSTAEDSLSQFVRLTLTLALDVEYPSSPPNISIHNPRGLSDDKLLSLEQCLQAEAMANLGTPVLYQLIEKAKEILTESNIPHGNCVICLYGFKEGEEFTKTRCYHYFHSYCLGRYVSHSEGELREREKEMEKDKTRAGLECEVQQLSVVCPVCREPLTYELDSLLKSAAPNFPAMEETIRAEFKRKWTKLQSLLERQREKGGVIDPEAESTRFLIHTYEAHSEPSPLSHTVEPPPCQQVSAPATDHPAASQDPPIVHQSQQRARHGYKRHRHFKGNWAPQCPVEQKMSSITEQDINKLSIAPGGGSRELAGDTPHSQDQPNTVPPSKSPTAGQNMSQPTATIPEERCVESQTCPDAYTLHQQAEVCPSRRIRGHRREGGSRRGAAAANYSHQPCQGEKNFNGVEHPHGLRDGFHHKGWFGPKAKGNNAQFRGRVVSRGGERRFTYRRFEKDEGDEGAL